MGEKRAKLSRMRKLIGESLKKSSQEIPQVSGMVRVDCTEMLALQTDLQAQGTKVSDSVFLIKAVADALQEFPQLNSKLDSDEVIVYDSINPGIGVDTPNGLMVLVLHDVQGKTLTEIAADFRDLMGKLKANKLTMDDISGGTFTVSVLSKTKADAFTSIVNNNECMILGMGRISKQPAVIDDGSIVARDICNLMINLNHFLIDGMLSAKFIEKVVYNLEHPRILL